ncbi:MAG: hypothetical protein NTV33_10690 [Coprothermobacterota bacterium]|nr:hypothetical protein [Coprothermobacterota bacterium]
MKAHDTKETEWRQHVLENDTLRYRGSPCRGGFQTRPCEDHSGVNHIGVDETSRIKGLTIPETVPATVGFPATAGFPGTAAPQCGISSNKTEANWV